MNLRILLTNKNSEGKKVTLIPYYSWANREIGEMAVWLKHENLKNLEFNLKTIGLKIK